MIGIRQSPISRSTTDVTDATDVAKQRPRANAKSSSTRPRCAALHAYGAIPAHLTQPALSRAMLKLLAVPQKVETAPVYKDSAPIRQSTEQVFKALSECESNVSKYFDASKSKNPNSLTSDKRAADVRKAYKIWRDSPASLSKTEMEKREKVWNTANKQAGIRLTYIGPRVLREILKQDAALERNIDPLSHGFRDVKTGLYCELRQTNTDMDNPEYVLCFPGTGAAAMDRKQWSTNISQAIGTGDVPPAYQQAADLTNLIKTALEKTGAKLTVAGHSMGGGIANYVGLKLDISSVCYNAAPLGGACLRDLGTIPQDRLDKQLHIRCKGDPVCSPKVQEKLQSFLQIGSKEKIWVPRNAGAICEIGKDYAPDKAGRDRHLLSVFDAWYDPRRLPPKVNINLLQMA